MSQTAKTIDPRTTRKHVRFDLYKRNSALYAQYRVIGHEIDAMTQKPTSVILQKKEEFCRAH